MRLPEVAASACLLGEAVRYDGGDRRDPWLVEGLGPWVRYHPLCPEVAIGLGVPRPPIRLVGDPARPRAVGVEEPGLDPTGALADEARATAARLQGICGYVFKARSPSCGLAGVPVYDRAGEVIGAGRGLFAAGILDRLPWLPAVEEGQLADPHGREHFVLRLFTLHRWHQAMAEGPPETALAAFHARHRQLLRAHDPAGLQRLDASLAGGPVPEVYLRGLMDVLARPASPEGHARALRALSRALVGRASPAETTALEGEVVAYLSGERPLAGPVGVLRELARRHPGAGLGEDAYLHPYPDPLGLREALWARRRPSP